MVMEFADKKPMFAGYPVKQGTVYLSAVQLNREITDLPVQATLFAPLVYKIAVSTQKKPQLYATIGISKWINLQDVTLANDATIKVSGNKNEFIPEIRKAGNQTAINLSAYTNMSGIYTLKPQTGSTDATAQTIALNYDRSESDLRFETAESLKTTYNSENINVLTDIDRNFSNVVAQLNEGTPLWKFCIIFVLIFLAAEILLIRFLP